MKKNKFNGIASAEFEKLRELFSIQGAHICKTHRIHDQGRPVLQVTVSEGYQDVVAWLDTEASEIPLTDACPSFVDGIIEVLPLHPRKGFEAERARFLVMSL